jgi:hypothetical protein
MRNADTEKATSTQNVGKNKLLDAFGEEYDQSDRQADQD